MPFGGKERQPPVYVEYPREQDRQQEWQPPPPQYFYPQQQLQQQLQQQYRRQHMQSQMERGYGDSFEFSERSVRHAFVRKVYALLLVQLVLTVAIVATLEFVPGIQLWVLLHWWVSLVLSGTWLVLMFVLMCCFERSFPCNVILLCVLTALQGATLGFVCVLSRTDLVLIAFAITVAVVLALTLFAFQTRWDFTGIGTYLLVGGVLLIIVAVVGIFVRDRILHIVFCSLGVGLYSVYLLYDTQLLLGGRHRAAISPEDYVPAVLHLYLDMILMFQFLLGLMTAIDRE